MMIIMEIDDAEREKIESALFIDASSDTLYSNLLLTDSIMRLIQYQFLLLLSRAKMQVRFSREPMAMIFYWTGSAFQCWRGDSPGVR